MHIGTAPLHEQMTEQPIRVLPSGWNVRSPRYRAALKQLNVQNGQELLRKSVDNPSICFLLYQRPSDSDKDVADVRNIWVNYFEEHFDEDGDREFQLQKYREIKSGKKGSGRYALIVFRMVSSSR